MAYRERLKGLLTKIEATYKTDSTPAAGTDGVQLEDNIWSQIEVDFIEENLRDGMTQAGMGRAGLSSPAGRYAHITAKVALKGCSAAFASGTVGPEFGPLLRAAGFAETYDATSGSETVTYNPISDSFESVTCYAYSSGELIKAVGCHAQLTELMFSAAQFPVATFEIWGVVPTGGISDVSLPAITYPNKDVSPPNVKNAGLTLNSYSPSDFQSLGLNMQTVLATLPRGNDPDGHAGYEITDWNPLVTVTMDKPALSSFDPWSLWESATVFGWSIGPIGATQYNQITLSGNSGRIMKLPRQATDGLAMYQVQFRAQNTDEETADTAMNLVLS